MTGRILWLVLAAFLILPSAGLGQTGTDVFDSNGVQINYVDKWRGAPVVLLHGFTGSYARHLETPGLSAALETAGYRVIGLDCRGHGQSGKPRDASQYGLGWRSTASTIRGTWQAYSAWRASSRCSSSSNFLARLTRPVSDHLPNTSWRF